MTGSRCFILFGAAFAVLSDGEVLEEFSRKVRPPMSLCDQQRRDPNSRSDLSIDNLIILSRADPIICGHSTETRNLAEAACNLGVKMFML